MKNLLVIVLLISAFAVQAADKPAVEKPGKPKLKDKPKIEETRELLAEHETIAKLSKIEARKCMGLTSMCPDNCGHSGDFASFDIVTYIRYKKPGEYGDDKSKNYMFQVEDNKKNLKISKELAETVRALQPGDQVILNWRHDYVTRIEGGGSSKFPDRPITKLQKITQEEADKLTKEAK